MTGITDISQFLSQLKNAGDQLKDTKGAQEIAAVADSLYKFSQIEWESFGQDAERGLKAFATIGSKGFVDAAAAISGLGRSSKNNALALIELSKGLSEFGSLSWSNIKSSLTSIRDLGRSFSVMTPGLKSFRNAIAGLSDSNEDIHTFYSMAESIKRFSEITWTSVIKGIVVMSSIPKFLFRSLASALNDMGAAVGNLGKRKSGFDSLNSLMSTFRNFAGIKWSAVALGIASMKLLSYSFGFIGSAIDKLSKAIGSERSKKTIENFHTFIMSLDTFGRIPWIKILFGLTVLKTFSGMFEIFSKIAKPLQEAAEIFRSACTITGEAIGGLVTALGTLAVDPLFWIGVAALASLGLVFLEFSAAAAITGAGVLLLAMGFERLIHSAFEGIDKLLELANSAPQIAASAEAIGAMAIALTAYGVAAAAASVGSAFSRGIDRLTGRPSTSGDNLSGISDQNSDMASQRAMIGAMSAGGGRSTTNTAQSISNKISSVIVNNNYMPDRSTALILSPMF